MMKHARLFVNIIYALAIAYLIYNSIMNWLAGETASYLSIAFYVFLMGFWWCMYLVMESALKKQTIRFEKEIEGYHRAAEALRQPTGGVSER